MPKLLGGVHIFAVHIFAEMHKERAIFPRYFGGFSYEAKNRGGRGNLNQSFKGLRVFINVERNKKPLRKNFFSSPFSFFLFPFFLFFLFPFFSVRVGWEGLRWVDWTWLGWDRWVRWLGVGWLGRWIGLGWDRWVEWRGDSKMCS